MRLTIGPTEELTQNLTLGDRGKSLWTHLGSAKVRQNPSRVPSPTLSRLIPAKKAVIQKNDGESRSTLNINTQDSHATRSAAQESPSS